MTSRSRVRSQLQLVQGSALRKSGGTEFLTVDDNIIGKSEACDDYVGNRSGPNPLSIRKDKCEGTALTGEVYQSANYWRKYQGLRPTWMTGFSALGATLPNEPSLNSRATDVINRSNPSRANVDIGVTLAELREAPQLLIRGAGGLINNGADAFLSYKFGWEPFVNDMHEVLNAMDYVNLRVYELTRLAGNGGLRRKINLGSVQAQTNPQSITLHSAQGDVFPGTVTRYSKRKTWGTIRWVPQPHSRFPSTDRQRIMAARRALMGAHVDATTLWNLLPWSWMVDWFGNLGDFIQTGRNTVGAQRSGPVCIMTTTEKRDIYTRTGGPSTVTGGDGYKESITKERRMVHFVLPEFQMPFLGTGRLSILGALAARNIPDDRLPTVEQAIQALRNSVRDGSNDPTIRRDRRNMRWRPR